MYKKIYLFIITLFVLTFISCSDSPTSITIDKILGPDAIEGIELSSDTLSQSSSYFKNVVPLGGSDRLLIGISNNVEASTLINFNMIFGDSSIFNAIRSDSVSILSATVAMENVYEFGDSNATLNFTAHEVTNTWGALTFTSDSTLNYNSTNLASQVQVTDSLTTFNLSNSVVLSWFKDAADSSIKTDNGIYLKPSSNGRIIGYQSLSSLVDTSHLPRLWVVYKKIGQEQDTISFYPEADLYLVKGEAPASSPEDIYVQAGLTLNSKIWFDISEIPANSIINSAEIILTVDTLKTVTGSSFANSLLAYVILDSTNIDSLANTTNLNRSGNTFQGDVKLIIQNIFRRGVNNGILLKPTSQTDGVELFTLKGASAADASVRPHLKIIYTSKK